MKDIREIVPSMTPLMFKDNVRLLHVSDETYVAFSLTGRYMSPKSTNDNIYQIFTYIMPTSIITAEKIGKSDFLIAWFDRQRDRRIDYAIHTHCYIGIANKDISDEEINFIEKFYEIDDYIYLKSEKPINTKKYQDIVRNKVLTIDKVPLLKMTDINEKFYSREYKDGKVIIESLQPDKISIPHKIERRLPNKPKSADDYSHIRYAMFDLQRFGGNSVYPFAWLQADGKHQRIS